MSPAEPVVDRRPSGQGFLVDPGIAARCIYCGHARRSHNELDYCGAGQCICSGSWYIADLLRERDEALGAVSRLVESNEGLRERAEAAEADLARLRGEMT